MTANKYYVAKCIDDVTIQVTAPINAGLAQAAAQHLNKRPQRNTIQGEYLAINAEWEPTRKEIQSLAVLCGAELLEGML